MGQLTITSNHFLFSLPLTVGFIFLWACDEEEELKKESRTLSNSVLTSQIQTQKGHAWLLAHVICLLSLVVDGGGSLLPGLCSYNYHQCMGGRVEGDKVLCKCTFIQQQPRNTHKMERMSGSVG